MSVSTTPMQPLRGLRVLDLSVYLPGPYLTRILTDLGAEVVKVEPPAGDPARFMPPASAELGCGAGFAALNFGKRDIVIDLKHAAGVALLVALAQRADILVESFRPGVLDRLGIGYERLRDANPRLIVCSISGYGQQGPLRDVPGHDLNYLARAGALALFGPADGVPVVPGVQIADLGGGAWAGAVGVLAAVLERQETGVGRHLDISMTRGALGFVGFEAARQALATPERRGAGMLTGGLPCYRVYRTADDRFMALAALEPKFFAAFCERVGRDDWAGDGYATGSRGDEVAAQIADLFASRSQAEWIGTLAGCECCCEPVRTPAEALADPALGAPRAQVGDVPALHSDVGAPPPAAAGERLPSFGADGRAVVDSWGIDTSQVDAAVAAGVFRLGDASAGAK